MASRSLDRHAEERRLLTRPLGVLHVIGASLSVLWLLMPHAPGAGEPLIWAATLGAYAIAALLLARGDRLPTLTVEAAMLGTTFVISVAVAASDEPGSVYGLFYLWATLYAFCFFTRRQALFQVAAVGAMYGAALILQLASSPWYEDFTRWFMTLGTLLAAGWLVRSLTDRLREREQHLRLGIEQSGIGSLTLALDGTILDANDAFARLVGVARAALPGTNADRFRHPEDRERQVQKRRLALAGRADGYSYESRLRRADGEFGWVAITSSIVRDDRGRPLHIFGQVEDITARVRHSARQSGLARLGRLALGGAEGDELAAGAAAIVARALEVPRVALTLSPGAGAAPQLAAARGWSDEDAGFALAAGMLDPPDGDAVLEHDARITGTERGSLIRAAIRGPACHAGALCAHGGARLLDREDALFMEAAASVLGTALARLEADRRVRHQALHDPLTGLPNRALLVDRLEHALARSRRDGTGVGAIFVDLDHFKTVNDRLGHEAGDELLRQVAARLGAVVREDETLARLGGDEFLVVTSCEGDAAALLPRAERLRAALGDPFPLPGGAHRLDASLGVAVAAPDSDGTRAGARRRRRDVPGQAAGSRPLRALRARPRPASSRAPCAEALLERVEQARQLGRELVAELRVELADRLDLGQPLVRRRRAAGARGPRARCRGRPCRAPPGSGTQPDRRVGRVRVVVAAAEDPLEHARVLAEPGPEEVAVVGVLAEPVDVEDLRQLRAVALADPQPVGEVVAHVVAAERQHRERVAAQLADGAGRGGRGLGAHHRAEEDAVLPVARLVHERDHRGAAAAEEDRVDRHPGGVLPLGRDRRVLGGRRR